VKLVRNCGGIGVECAFVVDFPELGGKKRIQDMEVAVSSLTEFDGN